MTVNQEMTDESSWIWLTSEQMGFRLRSEFANDNHVEAGSSKQCNDQRTDQTAIFWAPIITDFIWNTKRKLYDEKLENALEMLDLEWSKDDDTKTQCNRLNTSPLHRGNAYNKNGQARVKRRMQWEAPSTYFFRRSATSLGSNQQPLYQPTASGSSLLLFFF